MLAFRGHFRHFLKYVSKGWWHDSVPFAVWRLRDLVQHGVLGNTPLKNEISGNHFILSQLSESTGSTAELLSTTAMQDSSALDIFPGSDRNSPSDYDKALFLLKNNPPEQRLDVPMSYSQYLQLESSWSKSKSENNISEEKRYPSLSYDGLMQVATVVTTQSALHEYTAAGFREIIASSVKEYLAVHESRAIPGIIDSGSTTVEEPRPHGWASKEPDQSFLYFRPGSKGRLQVAFECGLSEDYKALCRDKDLWIRHMGAKVVVLICLKEKPHYRSPPTASDNAEDMRAEVDKMEQHVAEVLGKNIGQNSYGPLEYRGHIWLGKIDELFVEVWRAEQPNPTRKWLMKDGHFNPLPSIGLKIRDFFPENEWAPYQIPDSEVQFPSSDQLFLKVVAAMQLTARARFAHFLHSRQT
ncbi:hypothetical protein V1525DRAFT_359966 [Lipomyces kononenkoae]|uniref:Uncharacterized protein n=1 Tax=Lipomyces kononenkoae TaxID=34357 RepID=A0ACC3T2A2_LIPKO